MNISLIFSIISIIALGSCSDAGTLTQTEDHPDAATTDSAPPFVDGTAELAKNAPQVITYGGPVMTQPRLYIVTFPGDVLATDIEKVFAPPTTYWNAVLSEYGSVAPTLATPIRVTDIPPNSIDDSQIADWIAAKINSKQPGWTEDPNSLFILYYPVTTSITQSSSGYSCSDFLGYHSSAALSDGNRVAYAVVARCKSLSDVKLTGIDYLSAISSHEIVEAITDPDFRTKPAYGGLDANHFAWDLSGLGEIADMCRYVGGAFYTPTDFAHPVQRAWSNQAAKQGHDPCVPAVAGQPYFNSIAVLPGEVMVRIRGRSIQVPTVKIAVGASATIELDLWSDAPTKAPWRVEAHGYPDDSFLEFSLDKSTGQSGDKLHLTITAIDSNPAPPAVSAAGVESFTVSSILDDQTYYQWFGLVTQ